MFKYKELFNLDYLKFDRNLDRVALSVEQGRVVQNNPYSFWKIVESRYAT